MDLLHVNRCQADLPADLVSTLPALPVAQPSVWSSLLAPPMIHLARSLPERLLDSLAFRVAVAVHRSRGRCRLGYLAFVGQSTTWRIIQ